MGADPRLRAGRRPAPLLVDADQGARPARCWARSPCTGRARAAAARAPHADARTARGWPASRSSATARSSSSIHDARHDGLTGLPEPHRDLRDARRRDRARPSPAPRRRAVRRPRRAEDAQRHARPRPRRRDDPRGRRSGCRARCAAATSSAASAATSSSSSPRRSPTEDEAAELGFRLLDAISQPLPGVESTVVTASIGIALIGGSATDAREAIRQADSAMYEAKRAGGDRSCFFSGSRRIARGGGWRSPASCAAPRCAASSGSSSSPCSSCGPARSSASRRCCAGTARRSARSRRPSSSRSPRTPGRSSRSAPGCCARAARRSRASPARPAAGSSWRSTCPRTSSPHPGFALSVRQTLAHAEFPAEQLTLEITETALMRADAVTARTLRELESPRHPHRARRLRHRLLLAVLAQGAPARRDQDRPQLRQRPRRGRPRSGDRRRR